MVTGASYEYNTTEMANPKLGERRALALLRHYEFTVRDGRVIIRRKEKSPQTRKVVA